MKKLLFVAFFWFALAMPTEASTLQQQIDDAAPGATITVEGEHTGNFIITKPLTLLGEKGAVIHAEGSNPALTIEQTQDVVVRALAFTAKQRAVVVKDAEHIVIKDVRAKDMNIGIQVHRTKHVEIEGAIIEGPEGHYAKKGNGLALFESEDLKIHHNFITNVQDGLYIEEIKGIHVYDNTVSHSRYGTHFMHTDDGLIENNMFEHNVTGLMVMMVDGFEARHNGLRYHHALNGSGMLLYDVKNASISDNQLLENRVGLVMQTCEAIEVEGNYFEVNQTAIEATRIDDASIVRNNTFTGNILTARSDQKGLSLRANTYDDYEGIDVDEDGYGDTSYMAYSSFGQWMVRQPAYQYFVASPSVELLTKLDSQTKVEQQVLVDEKPRIMTQRRETLPRNYRQVIVGGMIVFLIGLLWKRSVRQ
ncbi:right-handed parallel beta-helix repeat-containing protein [Sporosarcina sp. GW1-11]|uniref:right-handed parallel beta-helix repeat-containing protein n=1 Tax=Sporosarcina sp. GW1-11 TaxID=2899126 RepID=UPI00294DEF36|nr:NosD domain-containing protein [Sporosarcina sp. GW1-11]MDV6377435.1 right-handed parallel beta-helix repeat-containing protein [Sporosarcina sp. GW1-11]